MPINPRPASPPRPRAPQLAPAPVLGGSDPCLEASDEACASTSRKPRNSELLRGDAKTSNGMPVLVRYMNMPVRLVPFTAQGASSIDEPLRQLIAVVRSGFGVGKIDATRVQQSVSVTQMKMINRHFRVSTPVPNGCSGLLGYCEGCRARELEWLGGAQSAIEARPLLVRC